jgi:spore coat polysaccharide biosynthesis protein SpsF
MTNQKEFWEGTFGDDYIERNQSNELEVSNLVLFSEILKTSEAKPSTILEIGSNVGLNLDAIKRILPKAEVTGLEVNKKAVEILRKKGTNVIEGAIEQIEIQKKYELVFTKGVLIHLNPETIQDVYTKIFETSSEWILFVEYYSRKPESIEYRGHRDKLFKRDFAGEFIDKFEDRVKLVKYGFTYHRDLFPQDDLTWFMMKKVNSD